MALYDDCLEQILNKHAPEIEKEVIDRSISPWFNDECKRLKVLKRQAEPRWKKGRLAVHEDIYNSAWITYNSACQSAKSTFFQKKIADAHPNLNDLFSITNSLHRCTKVKKKYQHITTKLSLPINLEYFSKRKFRK